MRNSNLVIVYSLVEEITYTLNMEMTTGQSDAQFSAKLRETSPTEVRKRQDALWMCSEREGRGEL